MSRSDEFVLLHKPESDEVIDVLKRWVSVGVSPCVVRVNGKLVVVFGGVSREVVEYFRPPADIWDDVKWWLSLPEAHDGVYDVALAFLSCDNPVFARIGAEIVGNLEMSFDEFEQNVMRNALTLEAVTRAWHGLDLKK